MVVELEVGLCPVADGQLNHPVHDFMRVPEKMAVQIPEILAYPTRRIGYDRISGIGVA